MIGFFIVAAVLLLTVLALIVYPLVRGHDSGPEDRRGDVIGLSRDRLEELKHKRRNGEISETEYNEQVADLEAQLADDLHGQDGGQDNRDRATDTRRGGQWVGFAVIAFVPVLSGLLYLLLGTPAALVTDTRTPVSASAGGAGDEHPQQDVASMVASLAARLEQNPDDPEGWFMLGRSYMQMNSYSEAANAFNRLRGLVGDAPEILVREASALALNNGGALAGRPTQLVQRALQQQPDHPRALWLAATAAYQAGNRVEALEYYRRVEPMLEGESKQQVQDMIAELGGDSQTPAATESTSGGDTAAGETIADQDAMASLQVSVDLDPSLRDRAGASQTVFIFAKAVNGPPMPLAVVRKTVADLPVTVTLDESQAMMPQLTIANFDQVTVGARISSSGQPTAQPGDLEGETGPVATNTSQPVDITINQVVPEAE